MFKLIKEIIQSARGSFSDFFRTEFGQAPFVLKACYDENTRLLTVEYSDKKIFNYYDNKNHIWNELPTMKLCSNTKCWELSQIKAYIDSYDCVLEDDENNE